MTVSETWRRMGDAAAFQPEAWAARARQFYFAAQHLRANEPLTAGAVNEWTISCLVVAQFNMSLAVELMAKALFLAGAHEDLARVYTHDVASLLPEGVLSDAQRDEVNFAVQAVVWAGRYPTPRWTSERSKATWDVHEPQPGVIDARLVPNSASPARIDALAEVVERLFEEYSRSTTQRRAIRTSGGPTEGA